MNEVEADPLQCVVCGHQRASSTAEKELYVAQHVELQTKQSTPQTPANPMYDVETEDGSSTNGKCDKYLNEEKQSQICGGALSLGWISIFIGWLAFNGWRQDGFQIYYMGCLFLWILGGLLLLIAWIFGIKLSGGHPLICVRYTLGIILCPVLLWLGCACQNCPDSPYRCCFPCLYYSWEEDQDPNCMNM